MFVTCLTHSLFDSSTNWIMITDMPTPVMLIILSGLLFAVVHSMLASNLIKTRCYAYGLSPQRYRLLYVILALLTTAVWLAFIDRLPDGILYKVNGSAQYLLIALQLAGILLFMLSLRPIDVRAFLGLKEFPAQLEPFIEQGIYRYLRHPMYSSIMLIMFAMPSQSRNSLTLYIVVAAYFILGSRLEEQRMLIMHPEYADYRKRVSAFIPGTVYLFGKLVNYLSETIFRK